MGAGDLVVKKKLLGVGTRPALDLTKSFSCPETPRVPLPTLLRQSPGTRQSCPRAGRDRAPRLLCSRTPSPALSSASQSNDPFPPAHLWPAVRADGRAGVGGESIHMWSTSCLINFATFNPTRGSSWPTPCLRGLPKTKPPLTVMPNSGNFQGGIFLLLILNVTSLADQGVFAQYPTYIPHAINTGCSSQHQVSGQKPENKCLCI